jgi:hypothetical protein
VYFIKHEKYTRNPKKVSTESDCCPEAAAGQNQRTGQTLDRRPETGIFSQLFCFQKLFYRWKNVTVAGESFNLSPTVLFA